jgi:hypothetical protein
MKMEHIWYHTPSGVSANYKGEWKHFGANISWNRDNMKDIAELWLLLKRLEVV